MACLGKAGGSYNFTEAGFQLSANVLAQIAILIR